MIHVHALHERAIYVAMKGMPIPPMQLPLARPGLVYKPWQGHQSLFRILTRELSTATCVWWSNFQDIILLGISKGRYNTTNGIHL